MNFIANDPTVMFDLIIGIAFIIEGLLQLFAGKIFGYANLVKKYTPESIERFIRPSGLPMIGVGIFIILFGLSFGEGPLPDALAWISVAATIALLIVYLLMNKKYLVKK